MTACSEAPGPCEGDGGGASDVDLRLQAAAPTKESRREATSCDRIPGIARGVAQSAFAVAAPVFSAAPSALYCL